MTRIAKALEAKKARRQSRALQAIRIEDGLRVARVDEFNWQIQKQTDGQWKPWPRENYFGRLPDAFKAIPATVLSQETLSSLANVQRRINDVLAAIEKAVTIARFST